MSGEDSGLDGWGVRVCACVAGKRGVYRALLWERGWRGELCGNGELVTGKIAGWAAGACGSAPAWRESRWSADWAACDRLCGMMRPLAGMAQKSP